MGKEVLTEARAEAFLAKWLPVAKSTLTKNPLDAEAFAEKNGFPVVLKIISPQALHKTEVGGVKVVKSKAELYKAFAELEEIAKRRKMRLDGILVQEFVSGRELFIGIKKDLTFGPVVLFGVGGIFVEVLRDVSFRVCPITERDALEMIDELKAKQVLYGTRGSPAVNIGLLKKILVRVSEIAVERPEIVELDINPFIINEKFGRVVDARIVVEK